MINYKRYFIQVSLVCRVTEKHTGLHGAAES